MNKLNYYPHSGHCYPDLVEKQNGKIIAEIRAVIWKDDFQKINNSFLSVLKEPLKNGINILFCAKITYDPKFGLSLRILDIDPGYTLGALEREKQETIERLKNEGIIHFNKALKIALLPKRIAVISVQTSKGYSDFLNVIEGNEWGYKFFYMLFPALLQGENAVDSIMAQLARIRKVKQHFDAVAIIRGGGADVGLTCYNNYHLSKAITLFPLPVLTGIGHSTNETVAEMVAFKNAITPTELADYFIQKFHDFFVPVQRAQERLISTSKRILKDENSRLLNSGKYFKSVTESTLLKNKHLISNEFKDLINQSYYYFKKEKENCKILFSRIENSTEVLFTGHHQKLQQQGLSFKKDVTAQLNQSKILIKQHITEIEKTTQRIFMSNKLNMEAMKIKVFSGSSNFIKNEKNHIENLEKNIDYLNPVNVLKRGYSISLVNGKILKETAQVKNGDQIKTIIADGNIISIAKEILKQNKYE